MDSSGASRSKQLGCLAPWIMKMRSGVVCANAGCGGRRLSSIEDDQKAWIAHAESHYGYGRVTVHDGASLLFEFVRTKDGRVHDSVRLRNKRADSRRCDAAYAKSGSMELDVVAAMPAEMAPALSPAAHAAMPAPAPEEQLAASHAPGGDHSEPVVETSDDEDIAWENDKEEDARDSAQWLQAFSGLTVAHAAAAVSSS